MPVFAYQTVTTNKEAAAIRLRERTATRFDPRAIPATARERRWSAPDGHAIRLLDWCPPQEPPRGSLLFMPGRGDAYEKYLESFQHWRLQGWRVSAADWRGQAGSGRLGLDEVTGHVDDFALWISDLASFWRDWTAEHASPCVLVGHSMGGHLALRAVAEEVLDPAPAALILSAPMLDVKPDWVPALAKHAYARVRASLGDPRRAAWKWSERPGEVPAFRQALLTHDDGRYADELWWRQQRPELVMGPGSWGWVAGALRSIRALERPGMLEQVRTPVLLFGTQADMLVSTRAIQRAADRLSHSQLLWFGAEARHEILREADPVRDRALAAIDAFLGREVPA